MTPGIEAHLDVLWDVSAPAKSQVIGIFGLQDVGYTLGRLLFPWLKKKKINYMNSTIACELLETFISFNLRNYMIKILKI